MMSPLLDYVGLPAVLYVCSGIALSGGLLTLICVHETKGKALITEDADLTTDADDTPHAQLVYGKET